MKIPNTVISTWIISTIITMLGGACQHKIDNKEKLLQWINQPEHGLVISKSINGFQLTAKYLPSDYLVLKELGNQDFTASHFQQLKEEYQHSKTFLLTIAPDQEEQRNTVMFHQVVSRADYQQRVRDLNFRIGDFLSLTTKSKELKPVLHHMENTYELAEHRSIYLVFADDELQKDEDWVLKFDDRLFGTGISRFLFHHQDLAKIPDIHIN